ncbi:MAG: NAD(P)/FAD-dependent oxidoreductase [Bacilli bacterium]|nr:NAD(P)/FAD-dependent oxidoreductase [Bacilli bacterium]
MKIVIVGGGAAGLLAALALKEKHPRDMVTVVDKNPKLGKKLRATGNGKANILNLGNLKGRYQHEIVAQNLFHDITREKLLKFFHTHHIATMHDGDYVYPYSESANAFTDTLIKEGKALGVIYQSETKAIDYKNNVLITDKGKISFDRLIIASGLASQPQLGADASFVLNLAKHGYHIVSLRPGLTPIKTIEKTKSVSGIRRKVHVTLLDHHQVHLDEDGELLFKNDGLSGIVIYHVSSQVTRFALKAPEVVIDFLPHERFVGSLTDYFSPALASYLKPYKNPKHVTFHVKDIANYHDSVATIGGVSLKDVDQNFKSKIESNVYIIGEALDQDGLCGGFNLMWAFATALKVSAII